MFPVVGEISGVIGAGAEGTDDRAASTVLLSVIAAPYKVADEKKIRNFMV